jgi:hypothetical protein
VITDIMGVSGQLMIEAMSKGVRNPFKLAELADRRIRASRKQLYDALHGWLTDHHRFMLRLYLRQYKALEDEIIAIPAVSAPLLCELRRTIPKKPRMAHDQKCEQLGCKLGTPQHTKCRLELARLATPRGSAPPSPQRP